MAKGLSVYRRNARLYIAIAACVVVTYDILIFVITGHRPFGKAPVDFGWKSFAGGTALLMIIPVVAALDAYLVARWDDQPEVNGFRVAMSSLRTLPAIVITQAVAYIGIGVAGLFFVIPGIVLWLRWFVVAPIVAVERRGVGGALRRSAQLTSRRYWRVLSLLLILWGLILAGTLCTHVIVTGTTTSVYIVLLEIVVQTILASYIAVTMAVFYFELSAMREIEMA
jgi:hypothetical protein